MRFDFHTNWITGVSLGFEIEDDSAATVFVLDLLILRVCVYRWKDQVFA